MAVRLSEWQVKPLPCKGWYFISISNLILRFIGVSLRLRRKINLIFIMSNFLFLLVKEILWDQFLRLPICQVALASRLTLSIYVLLLGLRRHILKIVKNGIFRPTYAPDPIPAWCRKCLGLAWLAQREDDCHWDRGGSNLLCKPVLSPR